VTVSSCPLLSRLLNQAPSARMSSSPTESSRGTCGVQINPAPTICDELPDGQLTKFEAAALDFARRRISLNERLAVEV